MPDSVEKIDNYTFSNCTKLNKITLGKGIKEIGKHAFCNTSIDKIIIPRYFNIFYVYINKDKLKNRTTYDL